jgi:acetyl-CoA carboxylase biotin carboxyl carrier protein
MAKKKTIKKAKSNPKELEPLEDLFQLLGRHGISEFEWEKPNERIYLKVGSHSDESRPATQAQPIAPMIVQAPKVEASAPPVESTPKAKQKEIMSPFVGTFYRSPSPGVDAYVKEGSTVKQGDVLCIIEAMKLMNEIEAEFPCKIVQILVENGQPVEFGEPLFVIEN